LQRIEENRFINLKAAFQRWEFEVAMRGTASVEAFHEPERQGHVDRAGLEPRAPITQSTVPMHRKREWRIP